MDKNNLWYVVTKGTNRINLVGSKITVYNDKKVAEKDAKFDTKLCGQPHIVMSITEYEGIFSEKEEPIGGSEPLPTIDSARAEADRRNKQ